MRCPRCQARLVKDFNGDICCYACGFQQYTPAELAASRRALEYEREHGRQRVSRSGINLH